MCIRPSDLDDFYLIQIPLSGVAEITWGSETFESTPAVASILQPGGSVTMQWHPGNRQLIVRLDRQSMERQLQEALGAPLREPLRFDPHMELDRPVSNRGAACSRSCVPRWRTVDLSPPSRSS